MLAINNKNTASTGISPFFLQHGYHVGPVLLVKDRHLGPPRDPVIKVEQLLTRLREGQEPAQAAMAAAQQRQEETTNRERDAAGVLK